MLPLPGSPALFWFAAAMLLLYTYHAVFHRGIPNIRTAPAIRKAVIELLQRDREQRGGGSYTIVDLGSGNGLYTRQMARSLPEASVVGIEIAMQSVTFANWLKRRAGLMNLEYRHMSFLDYDFTQGHAFTMFLVPAMMPYVRPKLETTKPGTLIISNKFPLLGDWVPVEVLQVKTLYLNQRTVYVYRKG